MNTLLLLAACASKTEPTTSVPETAPVQAEAPPQHPGPGMGPPGDRPPMRKHTTVASSGVKRLVPADVPPSSENTATWRVEGSWRLLESNAVPDHNTGAFPNPGNPNTISPQRISAKVPLSPAVADSPTPVKTPGWALNGVPFDPGAGEFYLGDPSLGWQYEALSGAVPLGIDENYAHVQPTGKYHYHGLPTLFLEAQEVSFKAHSPQVGWAADGFPIYALYGYEDPQDSGSAITEHTSSYRLKEGTRPSGEGQPGGAYDGTFNADYEYVQGAGTLDECNGFWTQTPEFPEGTYAYFLTGSHPVVPRCVVGTPDRSMRRPPPPEGRPR